MEEKHTSNANVPTPSISKPKFGKDPEGTRHLLKLPFSLRFFGFRVRYVISTFGFTVGRARSVEH